MKMFLIHLNINISKMYMNHFVFTESVLQKGKRIIIVNGC